MTTDRLGVFSMRAKLILASGSPRRYRLLKELGLDFEVRTASINEKPLENEQPEEFVKRTSLEKALAVSEHSQDTWVLGADTIVVLDNRILGKPRDRQDAVRLLTLLAGRSHDVLTGFSLCRKESTQFITKIVVTRVQFIPFTSEIANAYVQNGEPMDKAGAYGIQGIGGFLVKKINGSYSNVVGLPLAEVVEELLRHDIIAVIPS